MIQPMNVAFCRCFLWSLSVSSPCWHFIKTIPAPIFSCTLSGSLRRRRPTPVVVFQGIPAPENRNLLLKIWNSFSRNTKWKDSPEDGPRFPPCSGATSRRNGSSRSVTGRRPENRRSPKTRLYSVMRDPTGQFRGQICSLTIWQGIFVYLELARGYVASE